MNVQSKGDEEKRGEEGGDGRIKNETFMLNCISVSFSLTSVVGRYVEE